MSDFLLITGASSDIGLALAHRLLSRQPSLTIVAHSFSGGDRIAGLVEEFGERIRAVQADFTSPESVSAMARSIDERFGCPSRIVHLPALRMSLERITRFDLQRFRADMTVQLEAPVILLKQFAARMSKMASARVVFILSSNVHGMPPKFSSLYTTVKYAQLGLMRSAAAEYSATGFTVNAVSPSMVETQFLKDLPETVMPMAATSNPRGRNAQPEDILGAIEFLLSPGADYITGVDVPVAAGSVC